jgi:hypothetical protein
VRYASLSVRKGAASCRRRTNILGGPLIFRTGCRMTVDMAKGLDIVDVELVKGCGLIVTFSDGTTANYCSEELAGLRPYREPTVTSDKAPPTQQ